MSSLRSSSSSSSTLCCAVLSTASQEPPLSPMRIRVPDSSSSSSGSELSDGGDSPVATTPEAFTDSDNDSSFESEYDEEAATTCGSNSGMLMEAVCNSNSSRWPECTADMGNSHEGHHRPQQQQQQLEAPRPLRKVRFTLGGRESAKAAAPSCWGKEQRAVIQENALRSLGMLRSTESGALLAQQRRRWQRKQKSSSSRSSSGSAARAASKNRSLAPAPFKSTSANTSSTAVAHKTTTTTSPFPSIPTPASPKKKRKVSTWSSPPSSHRVNVRTTGTGAGAGDSHRRQTRPSSSRGKVAVAMAVAAGKNARVTPTTTTTTTTSELAVKAAATAVLRAKEASSARFVPCATTAADSVSVPPPAAPMDLSCTEDVDIDAAMKPGGEVRTPICRFLIPCWPEGVEGYEEAGGWRRLGGCHTKGNFPVGRRSI